MNPLINFDNLVRQLIPHHKRQPWRTYFLRGLVSPVKWLFAQFTLWRDEIRLLLNLNSQKLLLEWHLRRRYHDGIRILTFSDGLLAVGLEIEGFQYMPLVGLEEEVDDLIDVPLVGERRQELGDVDFIVLVPPGVDVELVRAEVEKYKVAGMKYSIIQK
jgi:hypothetical protein